IDYCRRYRAVLLVAELDRLSRRLLIIATLLESPIHFRVAAHPDMDPKEQPEFFQILGLVAEMQRKRIRASTKAGLAVAKSKGVVLGKNGKVLAEANRQAADAFALMMAPVIDKLKADGIKSERKIVKALNRRRIPAFRGGRWYQTTIHVLVKRIERLKVNDPMKTETNNISSHQITGI
ncbi:MAG: recombinase family protein, partial [Chitinophaga rupis]